MDEKLLLIDGHSLLFRAFFGMPIGMTAPDGLHTNAVYGFLAILGKILDEEKPEYAAVAFDLPSPTFRHKLYPEYKGTRSAAPDEFREQVPVMKKILQDMGIPVLTAEGWEADDILGTLAREAEEAGLKVTLVSGDRDLLQIASKKTEIVIPKTKGGQTAYERYYPEDVEKAYGVTPDGFIELKALMGDSSDNVPGLPGVGPKTAQKIMETYGSIENAHAHVEEIKPKKAMEAMRDHYDDLMLSLTLVTIRRDAPVHFDRESWRIGNLYNQEVYEDFRKLGFKSLLTRFEESDQQVRTEDAVNHVIENVDEFMETAKRAAEEETAAISEVEENLHIYAAGIAFGGSVYTAVCRDSSDEDKIRKAIKLLIDSKKPIACCNAKRILRSVPAEDAELFDAVIAAYLLDPLKADWSYDSVASAYAGKTVPTMTELFGKKGIEAAKTDPVFEEKAHTAAAVQAETAWLAAPVLRDKLAEAGMSDLFFTIEMPLVPILADMENAGILASREELVRYGESLNQRIEELKTLIWEAAGEEFNINSPKQLGSILFEKMHLPEGKKTKTGYSTAADVLEKLAPDYPVVADILEYRTLSKLKSTYADGLQEFIEEDGRIRTTFNQTVTATGRLSSADPNLQNIPMREELGRMIRKCFYPKEGCVFADADYSQIELRILAHMSGDEKLIDAYNEDKDIHRITASQVFHIPFEEVTDLMRRNAKAVNFGIVYGISSFGLSQGLSISRKEAQEYIKKYFETYPKIKGFLDDLVASAKENGYAVSLFGRRRPIPELKSSNFMQRSFGERAAMNSPIQGTAADIMKIAMIRVYRRLKKEVPDARLILQIHDELLVEVKESEAEQVKTILSEEMMKAADLKVPLETDCHIGSDWYEAK